MQPGIMTTDAAWCSETTLARMTSIRVQNHRVLHYPTRDRCILTASPLQNHATAAPRCSDDELNSKYPPRATLYRRKRIYPVNPIGSFGLFETYRLILYIAVQCYYYYWLLYAIVIGYHNCCVML